jgi:hypothetical protein
LPNDSKTLPKKVATVFSLHGALRNAERDQIGWKDVKVEENRIAVTVKRMKQPSSPTDDNEFAIVPTVPQIFELTSMHQEEQNESIK